MNVMIVESPNKVKKIQMILDHLKPMNSNWAVVATAGHFRDLPVKEMGINLNNDFSLNYEYIPDVTIKNNVYSGGKKRINKIKTVVDKCEHVFIATDPDREGEAIAYHLYDSLNLKNEQYRRITFDAITETAIKESFLKSRKIDFSLVHAQEARRAIDRLVGYSVSPLISDKIGLNLSAGRVQSVALRFVVELEESINNFIKQQHYGVLASFDNDNWNASWDTSDFITKENPYILDENFAKKVVLAKKFKVIHSERKLRKKNAPSPFSTSLLLQSASAQLKFNPKKTSLLAQKLFEKGYITYIRTDSVNFAEEAIIEIRNFAKKRDLPLPDLPNKFKSKEGSQEAHEAIRPTHIELENINESDDENSLYRLIWIRSITSQLAPSEYEDNILKLISDNNYIFNAKGSTLIKHGWQLLLKNNDNENNVPLLPIDTVIIGSCSLQNKETQPPKRFTEASLINKLEVSGIGRPSTYASTIDSLVKKSYISVDANILKPTPIGKKIIELLTSFKFSFIEYAFTSTIETYFDEIAENKNTYLNVVSDYYKKLDNEIIKLQESDFLKPLFTCKKCSNALRLFRSKKNILFWQCQNENCKNIISDCNGKPLDEYKCPNCKNDLFRFKKKNCNTYMWGCSNENCQTFLDDKSGVPVTQKKYSCPRCGSILVKFNRKNGDGSFWSCKDCNLIIDNYMNKPIQNSFPPCPKCQEPLYKHKGQFGLYWHCKSCKTNIKAKK